MNWSSFIELIQKNADATFFFSNTRHIDSIGQTISALCNSHNGHIIIGYDKINVHLTGFDQSDPWIDEYIDTYFPQPSIDCEFLFRSNKKVLILNIEKASLPICYKETFYRIEGLKSVPFTPSSSTFITHQKETAPIKKADQADDCSSKPVIDVASKKPIIINTRNQPIVETDPKEEYNVSLSSEAPRSRKSNLNKRQHKALNHIKKNGSIKNKMYRKLYAVSHKTAHLELVDMVSKGLIQSSGMGRSTCYKLKEAPASMQSTPINASVTSGMSQLKLELIQSYLEEHSSITEQLYADQFNINLAQAIEEIELLCKMNILNQSYKNNQTIYLKATDYAFISA